MLRALGPGILVLAIGLAAHGASNGGPRAPSGTEAVRVVTSHAATVTPSLSGPPAVAIAAASAASADAPPLPPASSVATDQAASPASGEPAEPDGPIEPPVIPPGGIIVIDGETFVTGS